MSEPLYKIAGDILRFIDGHAIENEDGEITIPVDDAPEIDAMFETFSAKVEACAAAIRDYAARAEAAQDEADRLKARADALAKRRDWIKEYVRQNMIATGTGKVEGELFTVSLRQSPPKCEITDLSLIPVQYMKTTVLTSPLKADIIKAIKAGEAVPGAEITTGVTLAIK